MPAPNFSLYGSTPGAASAQQLPWTNLYQEQNNLNERNRMAAVLAGIQLQEQQDRRDQEAMRFDTSRNIDLTRYNQERADRDYARGENLRRFNIDLGDKRAADVESKYRFDTQQDLERDKLVARPDPVAERAQEHEMQRLQEMADRGELNDERHVLALSPRLPLPMAQQFAATSAQVRRDLEAQDAQTRAAIDTVKKYETANADLATTRKTKPNFIPDILRPGTPQADYDAKMESLQKQSQQLAAPAAALTNPKNPLYADVQTYRETGLPVRAWQRGRTDTGTAGAPVNFQNFSTTTPPEATTVAAPVAALAPEVKPLPQSKELLQPGVTYQTARGAAMWDGAKFVR